MGFAHIIGHALAHFHIERTIAEPTITPASDCQRSP